MPRPGGNPGLKKYQFQKKYDWDEPCNQKMTLLLPFSMKEAIKAGLVKDWHEVCRKALAAEIEKAQSTEEKN